MNDGKVKEERRKIKKYKIGKGKEERNPVVYTAKCDRIHVCSMKFFAI